ncbi:SprT family zinc-dependent metalloprotease [Methylophilus sp. VKM B-3414]|uniref:M48 family metallopeptidase n=1 Tax=Methylophilus sp. VKM B-3414 TaxID=3076121 RepID=UPI0028C96A0C|nr:SprT family zinc-dependent metalloprotease [Methylophilus sp. VKM B-3414]MDT7849197.1 SprT family zinc-dependent metalloprotease [Methylophilus sp. VKM B-3414]
MITQQLQLPNGQTIAYQLDLRARRTIGLKITAEGLVVHAPKRISASQLQQVLQEKSSWIQQKLALREANQVAPMQWLDGEPLLFMGQDIVLTLVAHPTSKAVTLEGDKLLVRSPYINNPDWVARKVLQWYAQQALPDFKRRVALIAAQMGEQVSGVGLSNAKSRWGSCNSRKQIRLNWRLIQAPPHVIQYVVCHEMAHLKEMNHSARFYAVQASLFPQYEHAEKALKALSPILHRMA